MPEGQVLELAGLSKQFGTVVAVDGITARIEPGSVTGFLGPNGAGKTTTLRMLLGLVRPTAGRATIGGAPYAELSHPLQTVGAVLEASSFHPGRTAANHLKVYAQAAGLPSTRVDEALGLVGLADVGGRKVGGFSLGMRQRLGLASALLGDPGVLVLDEPANGLDPEGITWMRGLLRELARQGRTVLMSSHLLSEVQQTVDRLLVIAQGRIVFEGGLEDLADATEYATVVDAPDRAGLTAVLDAAGVHYDVLRSGVTARGVEPVVVGRAAADAGIALSLLQRRGPSLEDVFFELVNGLRVHPSAGAAGGAVAGGAGAAGAAGGAVAAGVVGAAAVAAAAEPSADEGQASAAEAGAGAEAESRAEVGAEAEHQPDAEAETETEAEHGPGAEAEAETEAEHGPGAEAEAKTETEAEHGPGAEAEHQPEAEGEVEGEGEVKAEPQAEAGHQPAPEPQAEAEHQAETASQHGPESQHEPEPQAEAEHRHEPESETEAEGEAQHRSEPDEPNPLPAEAEHEPEQPWAPEPPVAHDRSEDPPSSTAFAVAATGVIDIVPATTDSEIVAGEPEELPDDVEPPEVKTQADLDADAFFHSFDGPAAADGGDTADETPDAETSRPETSEPETSRPETSDHDGGDPR